MQQSPWEANIPSATEELSSYCCSRTFFLIFNLSLSVPCVDILVQFIDVSLNTTCAAVDVIGGWESVVGMAAGQSGD